MNNNYFKYYTRHLLVMVLFAISLLVNTSAIAQNENVVTGKVTSVGDNSGLPGVNISIKGTSKGTITVRNETTRRFVFHKLILT